MATYQITSTHPRFLGTSQRATRRRLDAAALYLARQVYDSARIRAVLDTPAAVEAIRLAESVARRGLALGGSFEVQLAGRTFRLERLA